MLLLDVHPAVWRRVRLADSRSIAELHRVIQLLMGWDDDHLHAFTVNIVAATGLTCTAD